jgi:ABC-2 type transport system permease protein
MSPRRVLTLAMRIVRQFGRDRRTLALLFVAPLLILTILNFVLNGATGGATLAVVPPPGPAGDALIQQLHDQLAAQPGITLTTLTTADQVDPALRAGDADGALIFPADFFLQLQAGQPVAPTLRLEGSNPGAAKALRQVVTLLLAGLPSASQPDGQAPPGVGGQPATSGGLPLTTSYLYGGPEYTQTDALAPLLIGLFSFFFVFLLTSVAFLRERSQGTLERVLVSPLSRAELVLGYVVGFTLFALLQSLVILLFVLGVLRVHYAGNLGLLFLVTLTLTIAGVNMGIFASAFARNELQVVQFIPLLLVPQVLLGGLFFPVATLPVVLKQLAYVMPLTYADFALKDVMLKGFMLGDILPELAFLAAFAALMVTGAALSLRQERI